MEKDIRLKAEELMRELEEMSAQKGLTATFEIHEERHGINAGNVYVRKTKPGEEVVLYTVSGD